MALVNLKTKYTSLKFGNDQKGGGDSGQPFVKFDMGNRSNRSSGGNAQTPSGLITTTGTVLSDFPKRGGTYPSNQIDYERIKAFLNTNGGKMFVDKQKTLQSNQNIQDLAIFLQFYVAGNTAEDRDNVEYFKAFDAFCKGEVTFRNQQESHNDPAKMHEKLRAHWN